MLINKVGGGVGVNNNNNHHQQSIESSNNNKKRFKQDNKAKQQGLYVNSSALTSIQHDPKISIGVGLDANTDNTTGVLNKDLAAVELNLMNQESESKGYNVENRKSKARLSNASIATLQKNADQTFQSTKGSQNLQTHENLNFQQQPLQLQPLIYINTYHQQPTTAIELNNQNSHSNYSQPQKQSKTNQQPNEALNLQQLMFSNEDLKRQEILLTQKYVITGENSLQDIARATSAGSTFQANMMPVQFTHSNHESLESSPLKHNESKVVTDYQGIHGWTDKNINSKTFSNVMYKRTPQSFNNTKKIVNSHQKYLNHRLKTQSQNKHLLERLVTNYSVSTAQNALNLTNTQTFDHQISNPQTVTQFGINSIGAVNTTPDLILFGQTNFSFDAVKLNKVKDQFQNNMLKSHFASIKSPPLIQKTGYQGQKFCNQTSELNNPHQIDLNTYTHENNYNTTGYSYSSQVNVNHTAPGVQQPSSSLSNYNTNYNPSSQQKGQYFPSNAARQSMSRFLLKDQQIKQNMQIIKNKKKTMKNWKQFKEESRRSQFEFSDSKDELVSQIMQVTKMQAHVNIVNKPQQPHHLRKNSKHQQQNGNNKNSEDKVLIDEHNNELIQLQRMIDQQVQSKENLISIQKVTSKKAINIEDQELVVVGQQQQQWQSQLQKERINFKTEDITLQNKIDDDIHEECDNTGPLGGIVNNVDSFYASITSQFFEKESALTQNDKHSNNVSGSQTPTNHMKIDIQNRSLHNDFEKESNQILDPKLLPNDPSINPLTQLEINTHSTLNAKKSKLSLKKAKLSSFQASSDDNQLVYKNAIQIKNYDFSQDQFEPKEKNIHHRIKEDGVKGSGIGPNGRAISPSLYREEFNNGKFNQQPLSVQHQFSQHFQDYQQELMRKITLLKSISYQQQQQQKLLQQQMNQKQYSHTEQTTTALVKLNSVEKLQQLLQSNSDQEQIGLNKGKINMNQQNAKSINNLNFRKLSHSPQKSKSNKLALIMSQNNKDYHDKAALIQKYHPSDYQVNNISPYYPNYSQPLYQSQDYKYHPNNNLPQTKQISLPISQLSQPVSQHQSQLQHYPNINNGNLNNISGGVGSNMLNCQMTKQEIKEKRRIKVIEKQISAQSSLVFQKYDILNKTVADGFKVIKGPRTLLFDKQNFDMLKQFEGANQQAIHSPNSRKSNQSQYEGSPSKEISISYRDAYLNNPDQMIPINQAVNSTYSFNDNGMSKYRQIELKQFIQSKLNQSQLNFKMQSSQSPIKDLGQYQNHLHQSFDQTASNQIQQQSQSYQNHSDFDDYLMNSTKAAHANENYLTNLINGRPLVYSKNLENQGRQTSPFSGARKLKGSKKVSDQFHKSLDNNVIGTQIIFSKTKRLQDRQNSHDNYDKTPTTENNYPHFPNPVSALQEPIFHTQDHSRPLNQDGLQIISINQVHIPEPVITEQFTLNTQNMTNSSRPLPPPLLLQQQTEEQQNELQNSQQPSPTFHHTISQSPGGSPTKNQQKKQNMNNPSHKRKSTKKFRQHHHRLNNDFSTALNKTGQENIIGNIGLAINQQDYEELQKLTSQSAMMLDKPYKISLLANKIHDQKSKMMQMKGLEVTEILIPPPQIQQQNNQQNIRKQSYDGEMQQVEQGLVGVQ